MDYRKNANPFDTKIEPKKLKFQPFRLVKSFIYMMMEFADEITEFPPIILFLYLLCFLGFFLSSGFSIFFFGGVSLWKFHAGFWVFFPILNQLIYYSYRLDNYENRLLLKEWCEK